MRPAAFSARPRYFVPVKRDLTKRPLAEKDQRSSLLEISWSGAEPLEMSGARRSFLEDGDVLIMGGWCQGSGYRVGFGEVEGTTIPS